MLYTIVNGEIKQMELEGAYDVIAIISLEDMRKELSVEDSFDRIVERVLRNDSLRFEAHDDMDVLCIHIHDKDIDNERVAVHIFLQHHCLWMVSEKAELIDQEMSRLMKFDVHDWNLGKVLYNCLEEFLDGESRRLDDIQDEIMVLEDKVIMMHGEDMTTKDFIQLRKRLLRQERCYEGMQDVLDCLIINDNHLLEEKALHGFQIMSGRVDRMAGRVQTLQDYVTEIREAYQAEVDIKLNVTMRIFTVITAVFLPLSLVAGWYGMNLKMPEYEYEYAYPIVIVLSVLILLALLIYFKKNKWF